MRNNLKGHLVYLSGSIDYSPDNGHGWRDIITPFLHKHEIGVINPLKKPIINEIYQEEDNLSRIVAQMKEHGEYDDVRDITKNIVRADLHLLDISNFVIIYLNLDYHHCGTYSEYTYGALERKPTLTVCEQGKKAIPSWLFGLCPHQLFFNNLEELKDYIEHVDYSPINEIDDLNGRWKFLNYDKIFGNSD